MIPPTINSTKRGWSLGRGLLTVMNKLKNKKNKLYLTIRTDIIDIRTGNGIHGLFTHTGTHARTHAHTHTRTHTHTHTHAHTHTHTHTHTHKPKSSLDVVLQTVRLKFDVHQVRLFRTEDFINHLQNQINKLTDRIIN